MAVDKCAAGTAVALSLAMVGNRPLHILVVDDDENMRVLWQRRLRGYRLTVAENGQQALALLSPDVDVILSDLEMPLLDGIGLLREATQEFPGVTRYLCTGAQPELAQAAIDEGIADRYFAKPGHLREVVQALEELPPRLHPVVVGGAA